MEETKKVYKVSTLETRTYIVTYDIEATSEEEARELFYDDMGDMDDEIYDELEDVVITSIEEKENV